MVIAAGKGMYPWMEKELPMIRHIHTQTQCKIFQAVESVVAFSTTAVVLDEGGGGGSAA